MSPPVVVFDLDGTLVDTAPDLIDTLNVILARLDLAAIAYDDARPMIGGGVRPLLERALEARGRLFPSAQVDQIFADYLEHYTAHIADRSRPFPGIETALGRLRARDCRLAVCTNKFEGLSVRLLEALGLSAHFQAVCGQDTFGVKKPDPRILQKTLARAGGSIERAILVGDSRTDIDTARATGLPVIAVDFGYSTSPIADFKPDRIISHFDNLPAIAFEILRL
ncbi:MAG: phosphoglycolate phosphatase [Rhizobiales bacterium]|nr:phosphoglycolate phosphatase [Hyphomicrobiales bacterium]